MFKDIVDTEISTKSMFEWMSFLPMHKFAPRHFEQVIGSFLHLVHFDNWKSVAMKKACLLFVQEVLAILYSWLLEKWTRLFGHAVCDNEYLLVSAMAEVPPSTVKKPPQNAPKYL